jgi:hypothetical protein
VYAVVSAVVARVLAPDEEQAPSLTVLLLDERTSDGAPLRFHRRSTARCPRTTGD